jgi:hypothetical protein
MICSFWWKPLLTSSTFFEWTWPCKKPEKMPLKRPVRPVMSPETSTRLPEPPVVPPITDVVLAFGSFRIVFLCP